MVVVVVVVEVLVVVTVPIPTCPPVTVTPGIVLPFTSEIMSEAGVMLAQLLTLNFGCEVQDCKSTGSARATGSRSHNCPTGNSGDTVSIIDAY